MVQTTDHIRDSSFSMLTAEVKHKWKAFLILGISMVLLGVAAVIFPISAIFAVEMVIGAVLTATGIAELVHAFRVPYWKGFLLSLINAMLALMVGTGLLLFSPIADPLWLALFVAAFLAVGGILRIILAGSVRPYDHWSRIMLSGFVSLAMAALILIVRPNTVIWLFGLLVGVDLIFTGSAFTMLGVGGRQET